MHHPKRGLERRITVSKMTKFSPPHLLKTKKQMVLPNLLYSLRGAPREEPRNLLLRNMAIMTMMMMSIFTHQDAKETKNKRIPTIKDYQK